MSTNPYDHIEETWSLDGNPFPHSSISPSDIEEPYSEEVFPAETAEFRGKVVRGAIQGNRSMAFLWSKGRGGDTGYGKSALMRDTVRHINCGDWGEAIQLSTGLRAERVQPIAAAYSELNTMGRTGLYPVLYNAVLSMAVGEHAPLLLAREAIISRIGTDSADAIDDALVEARREIAPTGPPLRADVRECFCSEPDELADFLGDGVSPTTQLRSGIDFLNFALIALGAAGVRKVFLMIDQLEDLATNKTLASSKRSREIGRIRDLLETQPYASMLHQTFTFHATAAQALDSFWEQSRLPSFEDNPANQAAVTVLRGLSDDDQVEILLKTWMEPHRIGEVDDDLVPFERDALSVLLQVSQGRAGMLLNRANELFDAAAMNMVGRIDGKFAREHFRGANVPDADRLGEDDGDRAGEVEDLLAG
jgi:hypothetical protein